MLAQSFSFVLSLPRQMFAFSILVSHIGSALGEVAVGRLCETTPGRVMPAREREREQFSVLVMYLTFTCTVGR